MRIVSRTSDRDALASQDIDACIEGEANPLAYGSHGAPHGLDLAQPSMQELSCLEKGW